MTSALIGHRSAALNRQALAEQGLRFNCGPLTFSLEMALEAGRDEFLELYREYPLAEAQTHENIVDIYLKIDSPTRFRRWFKPHVLPFTGSQFSPFAPLPVDLTMVTIEMGFNWQSAMLAPGHLILHAGVVEQGGRAIIMPGASGTGKSTLSSGLGYQGRRLFSDEFGLLRLSDGLIVPNPRPISLKNQSEAVMRTVAPAERFSRPYHGTPKGTITYLLPSADSIARMHEPAKPGLIVFPVFEREAQAQIQKVTKAEAFILIRNCSVNAQWLGKPAFDALNNIVENCKAYRIIYSSLPMGKALVDQLTAEF